MLASITSQVGDHGLAAVFVLMAIAAVLPIGSELVMLYGGAIASGALGTSLGHGISRGFWSYVAIVIAGVLGNVLGACVGWAIGDYGGHPLLERHGRWFHVTPERIEGAERWFDRFGPFAVLLGLSTPVVRSFIAIPAGIVRMPVVRFGTLALLGCIPWCFGLAGAGWALGSSYNRLHHDFDYVYIACGVLAAGGVAWLIWRRKRSSKLAARASDPAL